VADLDTLIHKVWSPEVRPLAEEALRCYTAGALRASIAATWTAVTADIITKVARLADEGDTLVADFHKKITNAQEKGLMSEGVRAMQAIERDLLARAVEFELIDSVDCRELERIQQDRNLCVHPSLRAHGGAYTPLPEVARGHLAVAMTTLLVNPPTQGSKALKEFCDHICDPFFQPALPHIQVTYYDRVRAAGRRSNVQVAAKAALFETDPAGRMPPHEHADRMAIALEAFAGRDRDLVRQTFAGLSERFQRIDGLIQRRALIRLCDTDYFWEAVKPALAGRLEILAVPPAPFSSPDPLSTDYAHSLAIVRSPYVRERMPQVEAAVAELPMHHRIQVVAMHPNQYFVPMTVQFLHDARSWVEGGQTGQLFVQHAAFHTLETLQAGLTEWAENHECRTANPMPELAVRLYHLTDHLGPARNRLFRDFVTGVHVHEKPGSLYTYPGLTAALDAAA
jgi:hypothetical protein